MPSAKQAGSKAKQRKPSQATRPQSDDLCPQKTISELFAESKPIVHNTEGDDLPGAPLSKKLKRSLPGSEQWQPVQTKRAADMYNFSSSNCRRTSEVIDLTDSPKGSPVKGKASMGRIQNTASHTGPRKLVIKNLKKVPRSDPDEYYNRVWHQLDAALTAIFEERKLPYSMEELYRGVEIACKQGRAPALYKKLCEKCAGNISNRVKEIFLQIVDTETAIETLDSVVRAWSTWSKQMETIRAIFYYLDRSYLLHSALLPSIQEMGTAEFRTHIFANPRFDVKFLKGACDLIGADRASAITGPNEVLLRNAVEMFHALSVYTKYFEPRFMAESQHYLAEWTAEAIAKDDLASYISMCDDLINRELRRCEAFSLDQTTQKGLEKYLEDILIDERQERLVEVKDVGTLLVDNQSDAISTLYALLQRRRFAEKLRPAFEDYIVTMGSQIVFDEEREQDMVTRLLTFKKKLDLIWEHSFRKHEGLGHSLREAFETFINKSKRSNMTWGTDNPKPGEMIAKYVDMVLKGGTRAIRASGVGLSQESAAEAPDNEDEGGSSEDEDVEIGKQLDQVLDLFRFVHGKAVFEAFYKRDLARRLLLGRSASSDSEKSMLTRLRSECGAGFTHNLEQMFKDMEMAREEISSYKSMLEERQTRPTFDLSVNVLSASAWPSYPNVTVNVPEHILKATASFEQHYKSKHTGRRLEWRHALAHCQLKALFPKGAKEIVVSCFQAIVLLAFNNKNTLSHEELQTISGLDSSELARTLQSLACGRYRVLRKSSKGSEIHPDDTFMLNSHFSHPKYRIKINQIQAKETKQENQATHERVAADRNYETQAAIVRIMKGRKTISHAELVGEVITATRSRGVLEVGDIKRNIEKLIDKDYMERDEDGKNVYHYVA